MEYIGRIDKKGHIEDLPMVVKRQIYDLIMSIDLEEDDKRRAKEQYCMHQFEEVPHIGLVVSDDKIIALIKLGVYDLESESVNDEVIITLGIPRDDIEGLINDRPKKYH